MRFWRVFDADWVAGGHVAAGDHDRHDAGFADQAAVGVAVQHGGDQSVLESVHLRTGPPSAGEFDDRRRPKMQAGAFGEVEQVDALGQQVFADIPGGYVKTLGAQLRQKFRGQQMYLTQIGLRGITRFLIALLHRLSGVRVALDAMALNQAY